MNQSLKEFVLTYEEIYKPNYPVCNSVENEIIDKPRTYYLNKLARNKKTYKKNKNKDSNDLSKENVLEIRKLLKETDIKQKDLAERFKTSNSTITKIKNKEIYKYY